MDLCVGEGVKCPQQRQGCQESQESDGEPRTEKRALNLVSKGLSEVLWGWLESREKQETIGGHGGVAVGVQHVSVGGFIFWLHGVCPLCKDMFLSCPEIFPHPAVWPGVLSARGA